MDLEKQKQFNPYQKYYRDNQGGSNNVITPIQDTKKPEKENWKKKLKKILEKIKSTDYSRISRKQIAIIASVFVVLLIGGGLFYYFNNRDKEEELDLEKLNELLPLPGCEMYENETKMKQDAIMNGDMVPCICIDDEVERLKCEAKARDVAYYNSAEQQCDISFCENIGDGNFKQDCFQVTTNKIASSTDEELGNCHMQSGDYEMALENYNEDLINMGGSPENLIRFATASLGYAQKEGKEEEMVPEILTILEELQRRTKWKNLEVYWLAATTNKVYGDYEKSLEIYNEILELYPNHLSAYTGRAGLYYLRGEMGKALEDLKKAREIDNKKEVFNIDVKYCQIASANNKYLEEAIESCMIVAL